MPRLNQLHKLRSACTVSPSRFDYGTSLIYRDAYDLEASSVSATQCSKAHSTLTPPLIVVSHKTPLDGLVVYFWNTLDLSRTRSPYFSVLASAKIAWRKVGTRERNGIRSKPPRLRVSRGSRRRAFGLFYGHAFENTGARRSPIGYLHPGLAHSGQRCILLMVSGLLSQNSFAGACPAAVSLYLMARGISNGSFNGKLFTYGDSEGRFLRRG